MKRSICISVSVTKKIKRNYSCVIQIHSYLRDTSAFPHTVWMLLQIRVCVCASVFVDVWGTNGRWGSGKTTFHIPQGWIGLPTQNPSTSVKVFHPVSMEISLRNTRSKWNNPHGHRLLTLQSWIFHFDSDFEVYQYSNLKFIMTHDQAKIHKWNPIDKNNCPEINAADWITPCIHISHGQDSNCIYIYQWQKLC